MTKTRYGRFYVDREMYLKSGARLLNCLWKDVFPVKVEYRFSCQRFEVEAFSKEFDEISIGEEPPLYVFVFNETSVRKNGNRVLNRITRKIIRDTPTKIPDK